MDDEQSLTWRGKKLQSCQAVDLRVGDQLVTPAGEAQISELSTRYDTSDPTIIGYVTITCALWGGGRFTAEFDLNQQVMRLERGESQKTPPRQERPC